MLELAVLKRLVQRDQSLWACPPETRECRKIAFYKCAGGVDPKRAFQCHFGFIVAFLHHQADSQIPPRLRQAISHGNLCLKCLPGFLPLTARWDLSQLLY
ncbi:hypothetical protein KSC_109570 [Ktedonobacter sp. SOSP1-52]|nr:hypothetical protein [Ktedonobacter sp. SOSP1-52]GHO72065.1 hypothetical protein KSC_109570 [Ktedonobacter sp. SOSP1-52]